MNQPVSRPIAKSDVLAFLGENVCVRYTRAELAEHFKVKPNFMRELLLSLESKVRVDMTKSPYRYWLPEPLCVTSIATSRYVPEWKPLVGYEKALRDAMNRRGF
ncbi:hypothetical protein ACTOWA_00240 [Herbaspirillum seropedicae]|uniref:hypothetical protein n=1 Tax=Herbaspirillum seropedicae TaxID=964 RepID=UPI0028600C26|nr:hypothetical protein [Herbaspirillum seropedicae]MDR6397982.1 hypothetical protein [Herbaspirillum seropedicae]